MFKTISFTALSLLLASSAQASAFKTINVLEAIKDLSNSLPGGVSVLEGVTGPNGRTKCTMSLTRLESTIGGLAVQITTGSGKTTRVSVTPQHQVAKSQSSYETHYLIVDRATRVKTQIVLQTREDTSDLTLVLIPGNGQPSLDCYSAE